MDCFVLLQLVLSGREIRLFRLNARERFVPGGLGSMKLAEGARFDDRHGYLGRASLGGSCVQVCPGVLELGLVVPRIKLDKQSSRVHELVILDARINISYRSADPGAYEVDVSVHLGVVRGFIPER